MDIIWYMFDMIGTIAFAVSGALVGVSRKMDIFGMAVLALATAIGGGVIRDVLLGYFPPNSLRNVVYVTVVLVVTFIVFAIYNSRYHRNIMGPRSRAMPRKPDVPRPNRRFSSAAFHTAIFFPIFTSAKE